MGRKAVFLFETEAMARLLSILCPRRDSRRGCPPIAGLIYRIQVHPSVEMSNAVK